MSIDGAQSVGLEKGTIENNCFKQIPGPIKIYTDFECNLKRIESYEGSFSKKYQDHIPCSLFTSLFVLMINLLSQQLFLEAKMLLMSNEQFLKSISI